MSDDLKSAKKLQKETIIDVPHMDIHERQPRNLIPGPVNIEVGCSLDGRYVTMLFPNRLEPMEGMMLKPQEARHLATILMEKAVLAKG